MRPQRSWPNPLLLDLVFTALGDATRRSIIERLRAQEATVSQLAEPLAMSLPAVSKHLRVLENAGLLERRIEGRTHYLKVNAKPITQAMKWMEYHRQFWADSFDRLEKLLEEPLRKPISKPKIKH